MGNLKFRLFVPALVVAAVVIFSWGCSFRGVEQESGQGVKPGQFAAKTGTLYFVMDKSGSMTEQHRGRTKFEAGKGVMDRFNRAAPEIDVNAALRTFGGNYRDFERTELNYGISRYSRLDFDKALRGLSAPMGDSALHQALIKAAQDLEGFPGRIALIVLSDGKDMDEAPLAAVRELKRQFGTRLCIYTVQIGDDENGGDLLRGMGGAGQCGGALNADALAGQKEMRDFVDGVFAHLSPPAPSAPGSLPAVRGETKVEPETKGETKEAQAGKARSDQVSVTLQVLFDTGAADIKDIHIAAIRKVADFMKRYPEAMVAIEGHTDNTGGDSLNMRLSLLRAEAVINELVNRFGILRDRLKAFGYGAARPIASNETEQGRKMNRRVEARRVSR